SQTCPADSDREKHANIQLRASSFELPALSLKAGNRQLGAVFAHTVLSLNAADWRAHVGGRRIAARDRPRAGPSLRSDADLHQEREPVAGAAARSGGDRELPKGSR